jgi:hypothetical protein
VEFDLLFHRHVWHARARLWSEDTAHATVILRDNLAVLNHVDEVLRSASFDAESIPALGAGDGNFSTDCVDRRRECAVDFDHLDDMWWCLVVVV